MERVEKFLKEAETYYLATMDGNQPRVRPFGTAHIFEGKLYIQTGKVKSVYKQLKENPNVEVCACMNGKWLRVSGELVEDDRSWMIIHVLEPCIPKMMEIQQYFIFRMQLQYSAASQVNRRRFVSSLFWGQVP